MYTLFEQIIRHRCVFVLCNRALAPRDALARLLFQLLLRWSPFNISLEWLCEYFI